LLKLPPKDLSTRAGFWIAKAPCTLRETSRPETCNGKCYAESITTYGSGSQTRGCDPFQGHLTSEKGFQILNLNFFDRITQR
jgi:hypothetical protein